MMQTPLPLLRDLVLIGGGHAHALVLRMWGMNPLPGARFTLINPGPVAPYTGMLPGHIAGHYARADLMIDLVRLARFAGVRVILDRAVGLDLQARQVLLADRPPLRFDVASIDTGIGSDLPDLPGFSDHAVAAKPLGGYAEAWEAFLSRDLPAPRMVIIGAGVAGMELALASAHRLRGRGRQPQITVLERGPSALPGVGAGTRAALLDQVRRAGITLRCGAEPVGFTAQAVVLAGGEAVASDFTLSVAGARPQGWLAQTGLTLHQGFVAVGPTLQSSDPSVFAAGDVAHLTHAPRPKAGVYAVRAAPVLHHNLRAALSGGRLRAFHPQRDYLKLVSTGGKQAVADKFGMRVGGGWLWALKDRIDRAFMARFDAYPVMAAASAPDGVRGLAQMLQEKPLCGGCGAKVGAGTLTSALAALPPPRNPDVLSGPGDDAAILRAGAGVQVLTTDHLRSFTHDPRLMARLAAIHALGDIWAMGAQPQVALAQITLPRLSPALQADMLAEVMQAATDVMRAAGADVVGGHTSIGAELTIGFTVIGTAPRPVTKAGARPGDALILTKPIGSGTILAAEMALARLPGSPMLGEVWAACIATMLRPLGPAAALLAPQAHAMTDVTGFGLAGHLFEMMQAAGTSATLSLAALPVMPGAEALAAMGQASSLAPANRAALAGWITAPDSAPDSASDNARAALLHDPQTCGGLLAAVPADRADALLAALTKAGEGAALIGHVGPGPTHLTITT